MGRTFYGPGFGDDLGFEGFWFEVLGRCWIWGEDPPEGAFPLIPNEDAIDSTPPPKATVGPELVELLGPVAALKAYPSPDDLEDLLQTLRDLDGRLRPPTEKRPTEERRAAQRQRTVLRGVIDRLREAETLLEERGCKYEGDLVKLAPGPEGGRPEHFINACAKAIHSTLYSEDLSYDEALDATVQALRLWITADGIDPDTIEDTIRKHHERSR